MNTSVNSLKLWAGKNTSVLQGMSAPLLVVAILALMVLPIPPWMLDTFFTLNIAVALMVMMVAAYMIRPLDFAAFPSVLLLTTLMRLSLNVASTRVVLLEGHTGPGAAGAVIEAFGHFLIGGNFAVGLIVFAILVVINFIVVTKGAERIAEVSARFTLDAMPGKQMAVDADLNAGLIDEKEAKRRRAEVGEEANFFGSMDGASKFVRGDAVAGILILLINIVGGFTIGVLQHGLTAKEAADSYILLAIGDALVAQIPGLLISVAAAMVVSRVGKEHDMGRQIVQQLFMSPRVLGVTAGILIMLGLIPGMPHIVFLVIGAAFGYGAWTLYQRQQAPAEPEAPPAPPTTDGEATWDDLQPIDLLGQLREFCSILQEEAAQYALPFTVTLQADGLDVLPTTGDVSLLNGLLTNLVSNTLAADRAAHIMLLCTPGRLCYRDNGPGLPPDAAALLTEGQWSERLLHAGGLGLPLVAAYTSAMGWALTVGEGPGMSLQFTLPAAPPLDGMVLTSPTERLADRQNRRRLIRRELAVLVADTSMQ